MALEEARKYSNRTLKEQLETGKMHTSWERSSENPIAYCAVLLEM